MLKYLKASIRDKIAQDAVISVFNGRKKKRNLPEYLYYYSQKLISPDLKYIFSAIRY